MGNSTNERLNDVNIEAVAGLAGKIQEEPEVAATRWNARVDWKGGFRSEAKIRDFAPLVSDEPDLAVGYAANATAAGIELRDLSIEVEGELDLHTFLGLRPGNAGYDNISVKVTIDSDAPAEAIQALHEKVTETSPVGHTLSRLVPVAINLA